MGVELDKGFCGEIRGVGVWQMRLAKERLRMSPLVPARTILLAAFLGLSLPAFSQRIKTPTLEEILQRLDDNLNRYDTRIPSFFCDEHAISKVEPGKRDQNTVTDSVFRLKRTPNPDHTSTLVESREIKTVNGEPATSQDMDGPTLLNGMFEGGLAVVSLNQTVCTNYTLERIKNSRPDAPYIVRFATVLTPQNSAKCLLQEESKGRVLIDPVSMQITRLELTTPHHVIIPGTAYRSPIIGQRVLTVDYLPVALNGENFWLPSTIRMTATSGSGTFHKIVWSFQAAYRNYHKLQVTSRIVPSGEGLGPQ